MKLKNRYKNPKTFKCVKPLETIKKIKKGFDKLGLETQYSQKTFLKDELYSGYVSIPALNFLTNGKGMSPELAEASAYAELAERISCGSFIFFPLAGDLNHKLVNVNKLRSLLNFSNLKGYILSNQDSLKNILSVEEVLAKQNISKEDFNILKKSDAARHWVSAYSFIHKKEIKVPLVIIKRTSGTNGMASGNNLEEAIVRGANEIFERYVLLKVLKTKKSFPTIKTDSIKNKEIVKIIRDFKKNNIEVIIKDFSFDNLFPCVGVLFINNNFRNEKNPIKKTLGYKRLYVESSFNTKEALIRCFASYAQGLTMKEANSLDDYSVIWNFWFKPRGENYKPDSNLKSIFTKNIYGGNLSFLAKGKIINFKKHAPNLLNCLEEIEEIKKICQKLKTDFIVVDQTHPILKFPSVRVIMPGISDTIETEYNKKNFVINRIILPVEKFWPKEYCKFTINSDWITSKKMINCLISEIEKQILSFPYNTSIQTRGLYNRTINLFELLASLYLLTDKLNDFNMCLKVLAEFYPGEKKLYNLLGSFAQAGNNKKLIGFTRKLKGCRHFLISRPSKNPLISWCDQVCENKCAKKYEVSLNKLVKSFFRK